MEEPLQRLSEEGYLLGLTTGGVEAAAHIVGDTLVTRADGIERLWEVVAPVLAAPPPVVPYAEGSWGPERVHELIGPRRWHLPANHD